MPNRIFFTGVPGSRWSGIARDLEQVSSINTTDHSDTRTYVASAYSGHRGAYFGKGMEFSASLEFLPKEYLDQHLDSPWATSRGIKILKSHEWPYRLDYIKASFPTDWIMLVYRPDMASFAWWHEAGGFKISYPSYTTYKNSEGIMAAIMEQNKLILAFGHKHNATWNYFTSEWVEENFGEAVEVKTKFSDILVTVIR